MLTAKSTAASQKISSYVNISGAYDKKNELPAEVATAKGGAQRRFKLSRGHNCRS